MRKMKTYTIDENGRVTISSKIRERLHLEPKSELIVYLEENRIIMEKAELSCRMCGSKENMIEGFEICFPCAEKAAFLLEASK